MNIVNEVLPGAAQVVYAEHQPEYLPLPSIRYPGNPQGPVTSRWSFTEEERRAIADGADLYLTLLTFHQPLQPVLMQVFTDPQNAAENLRLQGYIPPSDPPNPFREELGAALREPQKAGA